MAAEAELQAALLEARDARQALLQAHRPGPGEALVAVALNVPGAEKEPPGALELFSWALVQASVRLPGARPIHSGADALGPFALLRVSGAAAEVKRACVAIEASSAAARLVDLDVHDPAGAQVDRAALGLPPRACLCCDEPAADCIRLRRHPPADLLDRVRSLLQQP